MAMNLLDEKLRMYCATCNKPLTEIEHYDFWAQPDEETGIMNMDTSGFSCECENVEKQDWRIQIVE